MEKIVSAAQANRKFSHVLNEVRQGCTYIVTSHGKSVAKIVPFRGDDSVSSSAKATLLFRLKSQTVKRIGQWTRDELYVDK
jgi:prevent-host-death family protein